MPVVIVLLVVAVSILLIVSPIGIWNRLIKIHNEQQAHNKKIQAQVERIKYLLEVLATPQ